MYNHGSRDPGNMVQVREDRIPALQERVRRMQEPRAPIVRAAREIVPEPPLRCGKGCDEGQHGHAARLVGQFWLCLCLNCPVLSLHGR